MFPIFKQFQKEILSLKIIQVYILYLVNSLRHWVWGKGWCLGGPMHNAIKINFHPQTPPFCLIFVSLNLFLFIFLSFRLPTTN